MTRFYTTLLLFFVAATALAQGGTVRGKVLDSKTNEALIGASVLIKGSTKGVAADLDGNFTFTKLLEGKYTLEASYFSYQSLTKEVEIKGGQEIEVNFLLTPDDVVLEAVKIVAKANRESENTLLLEQRQSLVATQAIGARELSRKGVGDAQAAVTQVSGISKQEGVKNVFVRGLGDRYNATLLNGFPIPSEDPEYKNIALDFFGTDIISNIGVSKVFSSSDYSDVGGAVIDISSKELVGDYALKLDLSAGVNTAATGIDFLRQDGSGYFGFANTEQPTDNQFNFANSLDPKVVSFPLNHSYGASGGKLFRLGETGNPLSFFVVASHNTDFSYTEEDIRNANTAGMVWQDQTGSTYSQNTHQLVLGSLSYGINRKHSLQYNAMLIHANNQYVGEYSGFNSERYQDSPDYMGILHRQQINDNMLIINQLISKWELTEKLKLDVGVSYNTVRGDEPDRRENNFSHQEQSSYALTKSNRQKRFFSTLTNGDFNAKVGLTYRLKDRFDSENSTVKVGYNGRLSNDEFEAIEYSYSAISGAFNIDGLKLDGLYNPTSLADGKFSLAKGDANTYQVSKHIHSAFAEVSYRLLKNLTGNIGIRMDMVDMTVSHHVQHVAPGDEEVDKKYFLPSLNLKYDLNEKNSLRLGISKTYTLPQSKEISPYQYVNISFASQGNPNIKPSDSYNIDLKWDYYLSIGELLSLTGFYKHIKNPIGRVDIGNSAGLLTYDNISDYATVGGVELEVRKNIFDSFNTQREQSSKLSVGLNASYIYTNLELNVLNTTPRNSGLEGASPMLANLELSYTYTQKDKNLTASLVLNYFSSRIHTVGAGGFKDIVEEGVPTLNFAASYKFNKHFSLKAKAANLVNAPFRLTRESSSGEKITLNEYRKGQNLSIGISYEF